MHLVLIKKYFHLRLTFPCYMLIFCKVISAYNQGNRVISFTHIKDLYIYFQMNNFRLRKMRAII
jgi:hypothetical protein